MRVEPVQRSLRRRARAPRYDFSEDEDVTEHTAEVARPKAVQESKKRRRKVTDVTAYDSGAEATKEEVTPEKRLAVSKAGKQRVAWLCDAYKWQMNQVPEPSTPAFGGVVQTTRADLEALLRSIRGC